MQALLIKVPLHELRAKAIDRRVGLVTSYEGIARVLTNKAFDDLCTLARAPTSFMEQLPATLVCQIFNHRLKVCEQATVEILVDGETAMAINF